MGRASFTELSPLGREPLHSCTQDLKSEIVSENMCRLSLAQRKFLKYVEDRPTVLSRNSGIRCNACLFEPRKSAL